MRERAEINPGPRQRLAAMTLENLAVQLAQVFAAEPGAFVQIERGVLPVHVLEVENPDHLIDVQLLPVVLRRPAEQAEVILRTASGR